MSPPSPLNSISHSFLMWTGLHPRTHRCRRGTARTMMMTTSCRAQVLVLYTSSKCCGGDLTCLLMSGQSRSPSPFRVRREYSSPIPHSPSKSFGSLDQLVAPHHHHGHESSAEDDGYSHDFDLQQYYETGFNPYMDAGVESSGISMMMMLNRGVLKCTI